MNKFNCLLSLDFRATSRAWLARPTRNYLQFPSAKTKLFKSVLLVLCLFSLTSKLSAQDNDCSYSTFGRVLDIKTKEPIPFVSIKVKNSNKYATTNLKGEFSIENLCSAKNDLIIMCMGYCDTLCKSHHDSHEKQNIYLKQERTALDEVLLQSERNAEDGTATIAQVSLKKSDFTVNPSLSLASLISDQQGVTFTSTGTNVQLPVIHGLYGNRILVLNNGLKHGFQNWGTDHAPEIDINSVHRITIVKGAAGVRYGPEALGGAISVENNPLIFSQPLRVNLGTGYQSNGRGYFVNSEVNQGSKNFSYSLGANYSKIGDRHSPDYSLTNSGKEEKGLNAGIRYSIKGLDVNVFYSYLDQELALLRTSIASSGDAFILAIDADQPRIIAPFSYNIGAPSQDIRHHLAKAEANWRYKKSSRITLRYGSQLNKRKEFDVRRNVDKPIIDLELSTKDFQLEWKHNAWKTLDGLIGFQVFNQLNENNPGTQTTPFIPNYKTIRYSGFLTENIKRNKNSFELGIRIDYESNSVAGREVNQDLFRDDFNFSNTTLSLGYVRKLKGNSTFRTNLGSAWRTPNMAELYSYGQHGFKSTYGLLRYYFDEEGNPRTDKVLSLEESSVQPEKGFKFINEYKTSILQSSHTLTGYIHYIENYIFERPLGVFGTIRGPMPAFIIEQFDALFFGADYSWQRNWTKDLSGTFGLSYLWSKNIERNEALINQPPITANYKLTWNILDLWFFESSVLNVKPSYSFRQFQAPRTVSPNDLITGAEVITPNSAIFDFKDPPDGYFLLEFSWSFTWKNISAEIAIQNVLNTRYRDYLNDMRYFADEPGRNILFKLNYTFQAKK